MSSDIFVFDTGTLIIKKIKQTVEEKKFIFASMFGRAHAIKVQDDRILHLTEGSYVDSQLIATNLVAYQTGATAVKIIQEVKAPKPLKVAGN